MPETLSELFNMTVNIDQHLQALVGHLGRWSYLLLGIIIFCETALLVTGFLPTDALLFTAGAIAALGALHLVPLLLLAALTAIAGDSVNYLLGAYLGRRTSFIERFGSLQADYLQRYDVLYGRYGGRIILVARFVPLMRTLVPFAAGAGGMRYRYFILYNILGNVLWICVMTIGGYLFGQVPAVQENFWLVMVVIVALSFSPLLINAVKRIWPMGDAPSSTASG